MLPADRFNVKNKRLLAFTLIFGEFFFKEDSTEGTQPAHSKPSAYF
jgi:hypothetical protein